MATISADEILQLILKLPESEQDRLVEEVQKNRPHLGSEVDSSPLTEDERQMLATSFAQAKRGEFVSHEQLLAGVSSRRGR